VQELRRLQYAHHRAARVGLQANDHARWLRAARHALEPHDRSQRAGLLKLNALGSESAGVGIARRMCGRARVAVRRAEQAHEATRAGAGSQDVAPVPRDLRQPRLARAQLQTQWPGVDSHRTVLLVSIEPHTRHTAPHAVPELQLVALARAVAASQVEGEHLAGARGARDRATIRREGEQQPFDGPVWPVGEWLCLQRHIAAAAEQAHVARIAQLASRQRHATGHEGRLVPGGRSRPQIDVSARRLVAGRWIAAESRDVPVLGEGQVRLCEANVAGEGHPVHDVRLAEDGGGHRAERMQRRLRGRMQIHDRLARVVGIDPETLRRAVGHALICQQQAGALVVCGHPPGSGETPLHTERRRGPTLRAPDMEVRRRILLHGEVPPDVVVRLRHERPRRADVELVPVPRVPLQPPVAGLHDALALVERQRESSADLADEAILERALGRELDALGEYRAAGGGVQVAPETNAVAGAEIELSLVADVEFTRWLAGLGGDDPVRALHCAPHDRIAEAVVLGGLKQRAKEGRRRVAGDDALAGDGERCDGPVGRQLELHGARVHTQSAIGFGDFESGSHGDTPGRCFGWHIHRRRRAWLTVDAELVDSSAEEVRHPALGADVQIAPRPHVVVPLALRHQFAVHVELRGGPLEDARDAVPHPCRQRLNDHAATGDTSAAPEAAAASSSAHDAESLTAQRIIIGALLVGVIMPALRPSCARYD